MSARHSLLALLVSVACQLDANAASKARGALPRGVPEAEGVTSQGILTFLQAIDTNRHEFHSFMLVRYGKVLAEGWWNPYRPELKHTMYSVSKSFTSTAIGFAVSEHRLSIDDKVASFLPEYLPSSANAYLSNLTVKHLLTMSVGQEPDPTFKIRENPVWEKAFFETPILHEPGSRFLYNSMGTYMLSAIITKVTGQKVIEYLKPRLFDPLDITDLDWETNPSGNNTGGWGLRLKTEDMAKFGQLLLQKGVWNGKQVLSKKWIEEATTSKIVQSPNATKEQRERSDWLQGYCYQFWRCRHGAFRADGAFGQYIIVMPEQDAVIAITSETKDMQGILDMIWEHLLPAMHEGKLPRNDAAVAALQQKLKTLALPVPSQGAGSPLESVISGRSYSIVPNDRNLKSITFQFKGDRCEAALEYDNATYSIPFGSGAWVFSETTRPGPNLVPLGRTSLQGLPPFKIASAYRWKDKNTLELTVRYFESPHSEILLATFDGVHLALDLKTTLDPSKATVLQGQWQGNNTK